MELFRKIKMTCNICDKETEHPITGYTASGCVLCKECWEYLDNEIFTAKPVQALFTPGVAGYGHRLFLPMEQNTQAHDLLAKLSCWRGSDKRWRINGIICLGYEFNKKSWEETSKRLDEGGIEFGTFKKGMKIESI